MRPVVVDASVAVEALLPGRGQETALAAMEGRELWAPAIFDLEIVSALARLERHGVVTVPEADRAVGLLATMPIDRVPVADLVPAVWPLRHAVRVADAFYVAAAQALGGEVLTFDGRLARAPRLPVPVTLIPRPWADPRD